MDNSALLTVNEVAEKLGISRFRVYRRIHRGDLRTVSAHRGSTRFLVPAGELQRYIDAGGAPVLTTARRYDGVWMTTGEAAIATGYTPETIRDLCYSGVLVFVRGGGNRGTLQVSRSSIEELNSRTES